MARASRVKLKCRACDEAVGPRENYHYGRGSEAIKASPHEKERPVVTFDVRCRHAAAR